MACWYRNKKTGEELVILPPMKGAIEWRGIKFEPGDRPALNELNEPRCIDEETFYCDYQRIKCQPDKPEPLAVPMFEWQSE